MPWMEADVLTQRIEFVVLAHQKSSSISELCRQFGISRKTGYKWLKIYGQTGRLQGLEDRSRCPRHSPDRTSPEVEQRVVELRQQYGWGGRKLRVLLQREGVELGAATIDRILKRKDLVGILARVPLWQIEWRRNYYTTGLRQEKLLKIQCLPRAPYTRVEPTPPNLLPGAYSSPAPPPCYRRTSYACSEPPSRRNKTANAVLTIKRFIAEAPARNDRI